MGNLYVRVGNRTLKNQEAIRLSEKDRKKFEQEEKAAAKKRHENMQKALGVEPQPQQVTLDVTPEGIAKRNAAIKAEEQKIAAEAQVQEVEKSVDDKKPKAAKKSTKKTVSTE